jgi:DNA-binding transcriptional MerR regulator
MKADERIKNTARDEEIVMEVWDASDWLSVVGAASRAKDKPFRKYKSDEMQSLANVSKAQLHHWTQRGCIVPLKGGKGIGGHRTYSHRNLIEAMICRELHAYSVETNVMKEILDWLSRKVWRFQILTTVESDNGYLGESDQNEREVLEKVMQMISNREIPRRLRRKHTVWEFLHLYPIMGFDLFLTISTRNEDTSDNIDQKDQATRISLFSNYNINRVLSNITSSIIINLTSLKIEAGAF